MFEITEKDVLTVYQQLKDKYDLSEFSILESIKLIDNIKDYKKIYMVGIGGISMSGIALILKRWDYEVSGSDVDDYIFTEEELNKYKIPIYSFNKNNFDNEYIVIIGHKFIDSDNEEVLKAKENNKWYEYNDFLKEFIQNYYSIAVSGSHGKTTTTSLIAHVLNEVDECGYLIGDGTSYVSPLSNYFVFEACEHKERFLKYKSDIVLINNIDYDHVDYYKSERDYINSFYKFITMSMGSQSARSLKVT